MSTVMTLLSLPSISATVTRFRTSSSNHCQTVESSSTRPRRSSPNSLKTKATSTDKPLPEHSKRFTASCKDGKLELPLIQWPEADRDAPLVGPTFYRYGKTWWVLATGKPTGPHGTLEAAIQQWESKCRA